MNVILQLQPLVVPAVSAVLLIWLLNRTKENTWLKSQVEAINLLQPTMLGFIAILIGAGICLKNANAASSTGNQLITGGFALITGGKMQERSNAATRSTDLPPTAPPVSAIVDGANNVATAPELPKP